MSHPYAHAAPRPVGSEDVRRICGNLLDEDVVAILALGPSFADLETAAVWAMTGDPAAGRALLSRAAAEIAERLASADSDEEETALVGEA